MKIGYCYSTMSFMVVFTFLIGTGKGSCALPVVEAYELAWTFVTWVEVI